MRLAVGIPTRNRAELAISAVESVLRSKLETVKAIVSDNSTEEAERERLEDFCARQPPDAVEYVRPPEPLAMPAHWEWLRSQISERASPTHVTYLTDRMVFTAGALAELTQVADRHPGRVLSYQHDYVNDLRSPVELVQAQWTGRLYELDARKLLEMSSRAEYGNYLPLMLSCFAPVEVLEAIKMRFGDVFGSVSPDYCFAYRCLAVRDSILYLDRSCLIHYAMTRSSGISYLRGLPNEDASDFDGSLSVPRFGATPEPALETITNAVIQEYCAARELAGDDRFPPVDWRSYLASNATSAAYIQEPEWRARTQELLRRRGWTRRSAVRQAAGRVLAIAGYFVRHPGALARSLKRQVWDRPPGTPVASLLSRVGIEAPIRDDLRFASAADAIAHADRHPRRRMPYAWHLHQLDRRGAIARRLDWG
jgi:hypothetical protein